MILRIRNDLINYQKAHQNKVNILLHYFAFLFAFLGWIFLFIDMKVTLLLAIFHYILSSIGHIYFEKNKPGAIKRPWLGFYAGFLWFIMMSLELITRKKILPKIKR